MHPRNNAMQKARHSKSSVNLEIIQEIEPPRLTYPCLGITSFDDNLSRNSPRHSEHCPNTEKGLAQSDKPIPGTDSFQNTIVLKYDKGLT